MEKTGPALQIADFLSMGEIEHVEEPPESRSRAA